MLETLVVVAATTGLFVLAKGFRGDEKVGRPHAMATRGDGLGEDLPCPWCYAQTHESDRRCAGCGRTFG